MRCYNDFSPYLCSNELGTPSPEGGAPATPPAASTEPASAEPAAEPTPEPASSESAPVDDEPGDPADAAPAGLPEFDWNAWDGVVDTAPEPIRPLVQGAVSWAEQRQERALTEMKRDLDFYRAIGMGDEQSIEKIRAELKDEYANKSTEHQTQMQQVQERAEAAEQILRQQNEAEVDRWLHANREALGSQDSKEKVWALIQEDVDPDTAVRLIQMPDEFVALTLAYMQTHGVRSDLAYRLAEADVGAAHGDGRVAEETPPVAGAEPGPRANINTRQQIDDPKLSPQDARRLAVKRALADLG